MIYTLRALIATVIIIWSLIGAMMVAITVMAFTSGNPMSVSLAIAFSMMWLVSFFFILREAIKDWNG